MDQQFVTGCLGHVLCKMCLKIAKCLSQVTATCLIYHQTNTTKKNTKALLNSGRAVGLEVDAEKTWVGKVRVSSADWYKGSDKSYGNVAGLKCLGTTLTNHEEIRSRWSGWNVWFVQGPFSLSPSQAEGLCISFTFKFLAGKRPINETYS
jgi:hypothetical protein